MGIRGSFFGDWGNLLSHSRGVLGGGQVRGGSFGGRQLKRGNCRLYKTKKNVEKKEFLLINKKTIFTKYTVISLVRASFKAPCKI